MGSQCETEVDLCFNYIYKQIDEAKLIFTRCKQAIDRTEIDVKKYLKKKVDDFKKEINFLKADDRAETVVQDTYTYHLKREKELKELLMSESKRLDKVFKKVEDVRDQFPALQERLNLFIRDPIRYKFDAPKKRVKKEKALYDPKTQADQKQAEQIYTMLPTKIENITEQMMITIEKLDNFPASCPSSDNKLKIIVP